MADERQFPEGSRMDNLEFSGVHLHAASFEGARLTDADLSGADISGAIAGTLVNGVEIEPLVQAELDRRCPERVKLRALDVAGLREGWAMLEDLWGATTDRAASLPEGLQSRRVDGEWSFLETLRHLIFATDCWLFRGVHLASRPYHPWGLPWAGVSAEWSGQLGLDVSATPSLDALLPVRRDHQQAVRATLEQLTEGELAEVRNAPDEPGHPTGAHAVRDCLHVLLREEWEHHRYAVRDLDAL
jgi:hypothetical protein